MKTKPYLKLPPLSSYDDYKSEGIKNQNTYSYKKGGYIKFIKELKCFSKEYKNKQK
ncbi:hypothetical protein OJP00_06180 [Campylobacter lari]|uniref:hypothetical protein n=1 Tax=Campylobacter lari TaxID=201 RepID=UPI0021F7150F|nr:hypothetical protein [Campylobacter lari]MCW0186148.1 hypothetical protein [Campylobacter lari]